MRRNGFLVRIPSNPAGHSIRRRPWIPRDSGHSFQMIPAKRSERSDAVNGPLPFWCFSGQACFRFSHRLSFEMQFMGVVHQPVENGIGQGGVTNLFMPVLQGKLAGHQG